MSFPEPMAKQNVKPTPLFACPGFTWMMILVDTLHALDLGVSQDTLGNLFYAFWYSPLSKARNQTTKTLELLALIKEYYKQYKPQSRITGLTVEMIKRDKSGPKFRAKGAETRHLVPFGLILANKMAEAAGGHDVFYNHLVSLMQHLVTFYNTYGQIPYDADKTNESARLCCLLYAQLRDIAVKDQFWKIKPKFHLFQELAECQTYATGDPSLFWCYLDEDFVGLIGKISASRGGKRKATTSPNTVMKKYRALAG